MAARSGPAVVDVHHVGEQQTGNESWSLNVARELAALGGDADLVFATGPSGVETVRRITGREAALLPGRSSTRLAIGLPRLLRRLRSRACLVTYTPPLDIRTPMVVAVHDLSAFDPQMQSYLPTRAAARYRWSIRLATRRAARIVVPTRHTAADLHRHTGFPADRTVIAAIPVDPGLAAMLGRERPPRSSVFRVLYVGALLPRKNVRVVADAIALLRARGHDVQLRLVGPRPPHGRAESDHVVATLGPAASWSGYVTTEQLAAEYLRADAFAYPSLYEGFGIPMLEAMTAGTPVLASRASCLPEVAGDAARLLDPHDPAAWAHAIAELVGDSSAREALTRLGVRRAAHYTWPESGKRIHAALVAAGRG